MIKYILFAAALFPPMAAAAQNNWELPSGNGQTSQQNTVKESKKQKDNTKDGTSTEVIDGVTYVIKDADRPYLAGAVPESDGNVVFSADIETAGMNAGEAYDKAYKYMENVAAGEQQTEKSKIAIVDQEQHSIIGTYAETLVFSKKLLELDQTLFNYVIITDCKDGTVHVSIERLPYDYTDGKETTHITAEEMITDGKMLSNNGTKLKKQNSKFRKATVDRMRELLAGFREALQPTT